jgi:hypothetical protein
VSHVVRVALLGSEVKTVPLSLHQASGLCGGPHGHTRPSKGAGAVSRGCAGLEADPAAVDTPVPGDLIVNSGSEVMSFPAVARSGPAADALPSFEEYSVGRTGSCHRRGRDETSERSADQLRR